MTGLQELDVRQLFPHPQNPRKNLGELTELADSIKANGIFQNLTVVPRVSEQGNPMGYTVIIGHRRLAAAKAAGLMKVPCAVVEMTEREQLSTMMVENMQRSDLTVVEQAEGFQLMLDMGDSVQDIVDKSGFSETTVRRRLKLLKLDRAALKGADMRGGTLEDYAKLDKIKRDDLRTQVLQTVGTNNFENALHNALLRERDDAKLDEWEGRVSEWATKTEAMKGLDFVVSYYTWNDPKQKIVRPKDAQSVKYYYIRRDHAIEICREKQEEKKKTNERAARLEERRREVDRITGELRAITNTHRIMRHTFIQTIAADKKRWLDTVIRWAAVRLLTEYTAATKSTAAQLLGTEYDQKNWVDDVKTIVEQNPEYALLVGIFADVEIQYGNPNWVESRDSENFPVIVYSKNEKVETMYRFLLNLGYEMSDEEKQIVYGGHRLYTQSVGPS